MSRHICVSIDNLLIEHLFVEYAKDQPDSGMATDLNGGWPQHVFERVYGKFGFNEWLSDLSDERLVELLTTGKPTTLCIWIRRLWKVWAELNWAMTTSKLGRQAMLAP